MIYFQLLNMPLSQTLELPQTLLYRVNITAGETETLPLKVFSHISCFYSNCVCNYYWASSSMFSAPNCLCSFSRYRQKRIYFILKVSLEPIGIPFTIHDIISQGRKRTWTRIYPRTLRNFSISTCKLPFTYIHLSLFCSTSICMWSVLNITKYTELKMRRR